MNPEHEPYVKILIANMAKAKLGALESKAVMIKFLREAAETNPAQALVKACEGWDDGQVMLGSLIKEGLERLSNEHPGIPLGHGERARRDIERFKKNVGKLECEIVLTEQDRARLTKNQLENFERAETQRRQPLDVEIPSCFFSQASYKGKQFQVELEVRK